MVHPNLTPELRKARQIYHQSSPKTKIGHALRLMIEVSGELHETQEEIALTNIDKIGEENPEYVRIALVNGLTSVWTEKQVKTFLEKHNEYTDYLLTPGDWFGDS